MPPRPAKGKPDGFWKRLAVACSCVPIYLPPDADRFDSVVVDKGGRAGSAKPSGINLAHSGSAAGGSVNGSRLGPSPLGGPMPSGRGHSSQLCMRNPDLGPSSSYSYSSQRPPAVTKGVLSYTMASSPLQHATSPHDVPPHNLSSPTQGRHREPREPRDPSPHAHMHSHGKSRAGREANEYLTTTATTTDGEDAAPREPLMRDGASGVESSMPSSIDGAAGGADNSSRPASSRRREPRSAGGRHRHATPGGASANGYAVEDASVGAGGLSGPEAEVAGPYASDDPLSDGGDGLPSDSPFLSPAAASVAAGVPCRISMPQLGVGPGPPVARVPSTASAVDPIREQMNAALARMRINNSMPRGQKPHLHLNVQLADGSTGAPSPGGAGPSSGLGTREASITAANGRRLSSTGVPSPRVQSFASPARGPGSGFGPGLAAGPGSGSHHAHNHLQYHAPTQQHQHQHAQSYAVYGNSAAQALQLQAALAHIAAGGSLAPPAAAGPGEGGISRAHSGPLGRQKSSSLAAGGGGGGGGAGGVMSGTASPRNELVARQGSTLGGVGMGRPPEMVQRQASTITPGTPRGGSRLAGTGLVDYGSGPAGHSPVVPNLTMPVMSTVMLATRKFAAGGGRTGSFAAGEAGVMVGRMGSVTGAPGLTSPR